MVVVNPRYATVSDVSSRHNGGHNPLVFSVVPIWGSFRARTSAFDYPPKDMMPNPAIAANRTIHPQLIPFLGNSSKFLVGAGLYSLPV